MDSLSEPLDIGGCDTRDGYSTVFGGVDGMLDGNSSVKHARLYVHTQMEGRMTRYLHTSLANLSICSGFSPV